MKALIAAAVASTAAFAGVGALGVAAAEAPTSGSALRSVSVEGTATVPLDPRASSAAADAAYHQAIANAVTDAQTKAQVMASRAGVTLGVIQTLTEGGGYVGCASGEYEGAQADFGSGAVPGAIARPVAAVPGRPVKRHKGASVPSAKGASASGCEISAQISLVYLIS